MSLAGGGDDPAGDRPPATSPSKESETKRKQELGSLLNLAPSGPELPSTSQVPPAEKTSANPTGVHRSLEPPVLAETVLSPISCDKTITLFPYSSYRVGSKEEKDPRGGLDRMRKNEYKGAEGMQIRVEGIILVTVGQLDDARVLVLERDSLYQLPGGYLKPGENEVEGLKRILNSQLGASSESSPTNWQIGECVGKQWLSVSEQRAYPFAIGKCKECTKYFIVHLAGGERMDVPRNFNVQMLSFPTLSEPQFSGLIFPEIPHMLSRYDFKFLGSQGE